MGFQAHILILELKGLTLPAKAKEFGSVPADPFIPIYPQVKKEVKKSGYIFWMWRFKPGSA